MKKKILAVLLTGVLLGTMSGCGSSSTESKVETGTTVEKEGESTEQTKEDDNSAGEQKTVRIGFVSSGEIAPDAMGIAMEEGFLEEELEKVGYKPDYYPLQSGVVANESFTSGNIDIGVYGDTAAITLRANGIDVKAFSVGTSVSHLGIIASENSGIKTCEDLAGKNISVLKGTVMENYLYTRLSDFNLSKDDVNIVNDNSAYYSGSTDALVLPLYVLYGLEDQTKGNIIDTTIGHDDWTSQTLAIGEASYLEENPDVPVAIIRALDRAQKFAFENPDAAYEINAKAYNNAYTPEAFKRLAEETDSKFENIKPVINDQTKQRLEKLGEQLVNNGQISQNIDVNEFVDTTYFEKAEKE